MSVTINPVERSSRGGTPYDIRLTGKNQLGSITKEVSTTPLIGETVCLVCITWKPETQGSVKEICGPFLPLPSLSGRPSIPQVTLTPTAGGLTVQLTAMYPGTREDTLQYSISTSASPRSRRQTGQQTLPVTDLTTPISGSAEVSLGPGTYSVTVTVTNQHGSTTSEPQEVTIPGQLCVVHFIIC